MPKKTEKFYYDHLQREIDLLTEEKKKLEEKVNHLRKNLLKLSNNAKTSDKRWKSIQGRRKSFIPSTKMSG